jgi:diadenylate cyclase
VNQYILLLINVLDIVIVTFLFYRLYILVRDTRAALMLNGFLVIFLAGLFARWMGFTTLSWIVDSLRTVWAIAFIVLFQHELRAALAQIGRNRLVGRFLRVKEDRGYIAEIVRAVGDLKRDGLGALIVIERETGLRNYAENGVLLEAEISAELLETLFTPPSPLHDGGVIVRGKQVVAARVILPLSESGRGEAHLGTRHRAALGISEESDAVVVVVSEETHKVSLCEHGIMDRDLDQATLRQELIGRLTPADEKAETTAETDLKAAKQI